MNVLLLLLGFVLGGVITQIIFGAFRIGVLRIDRSDPDGPYLFLELSKDVSYFSNKKYVLLRVNDKNYISQK